MVTKIQVEFPVALIVEPHDALRAALRAWIETPTPMVSVLEANCLKDALEILAATAVDVVLMDMCAPGMNGIEGIRAIRNSAPATSVVICSLLDDTVYVDAARAAGALAFVSKRRIAEDLLPVLCNIASLRSSLGGANAECGT